MDGEGTFNHIFHPAFTDAVLAFERYFAVDFAVRGGVGGFAQFMVVKHA